MKYRKISAIYSIVVGLGMAAILAVLFVTRPDYQAAGSLQTIPFSFSMAVASNSLTAFALLAAGAAFLLRAAWANKAFLLGMVALFCSVINALGLYGQGGNVALLSVFDIGLIGGLILTVLALKQMPAAFQTVTLNHK